MRLQVIDETVNFSCGSCTYCCDQPWHTLIERERVHALEQHDFSAYPQLSGHKLYHETKTESYFKLSKGEGNRCLFLDSDGLCIIHKELGLQAKPLMCQRFPFLRVFTATDDRISANYGCPAVQDRNGTPLVDQQDAIVKVFKPSQQPSQTGPLVALDSTYKLTQAEADALLARALVIFDDHRDADIWSRFAELLMLLAAVAKYKYDLQQADGGKPDDLQELLEPGQAWPETSKVPEVYRYAKPMEAPMPARFLFAATLYPDTVPPDATSPKHLLKRLMMIPNLFSLTTMSGIYPSRLLGRNVSIAEVLKYEVGNQLDSAASALLFRYYRSRLWQRFLIGSKLSVVGGIHQHIHDLNAVLFFARAEAQHRDQDRLTEDLIKQALTCVEFHLANQTRLFEKTLKGWLKGSLNNGGLALASLRLMALKHEQVSTAAQT